MDAKQLIEALLQSGLTQVAIAKETGVSQSTLSKVVNGEVEDIRSRSYRELEALLTKVRRRKPAAIRAAVKA